MAKNQMAFPDWLRDGMSLRDWFAGQAIAGRAIGSGNASTLARAAYELADAMLAERDRK